MEYRNDIDGLRAVAVLSVVLFHLGFSKYLSGGFVGVDVFFVISGYLITGIIQAEVAGQRLSIARFYERRIRRIFPALFSVHLFCLASAAVLLFPSEAQEVGRDVLSSLGFVSNVVFARAEGDYFNQSSSVRLLLHTWSLSVEEQFYFAFPLLLWALARLGRLPRILLLSVLATLSFALSVWAVRVDARSAFYLVQNRAWELLLGSLLALGAFGRLRSRPLAEGLAAAGLGLVLFAVVWLDENRPFPGFWALPPCLGAVFLLHSGGEVRTLVARLLGSEPLRFIGRISYSLYLWHWPLIALVRAREVPLTLAVRLALLAVAVGISALSYRYVERPFRQKPYRLGTRRVLELGGLGMACVGACALGAPAAAAALRPKAVLAEQLVRYRKTRVSKLRTGSCFLDGGYDDFGSFRKDLCLKLEPGRKNLLVMGDSHAAHFTPAFAEVRPDINVLQATASGCQPLYGGVGTRRCTQLFSFIFDEFLPKNHVDTVVLAGHWPAGLGASLKKTISYLKPLTGRVVVLGPGVEYDDSLPRLLARGLMDDDPSLPERHRLGTGRALDKQYKRELAHTDADYYSVYDATCPHKKCTLWAKPGVPMLQDSHHLSLPGAILVLERLGPTVFR